MSTSEERAPARYTLTKFHLLMNDVNPDHTGHAFLLPVKFNRSPTIVSAATDVGSGGYRQTPYTLEGHFSDLKSKAQKIQRKLILSRVGPGAVSMCVSV